MAATSVFMDQFTPPVKPEVPAAGDGWARNAVDRFVAERLEREELQPSPEADPVTLLRRVSFDLVGLPPTPEEADAFLAAWAGDRARDVDDHERHQVVRKIGQRVNGIAEHR